MRRYTRDGLNFDVRDSGPDNGIPVILLHGFPQTSTSWSKVEPLLHSAGIRTIAPDQRGYSPAARPLARRAYAMTELTADVVALLDAIGHKSAHVVGHDWGGAVVWGLAGQHPDRFRSATVLSTPHPAALTKAFRTSTQALKSWYMAVNQIPGLPELLVRDKAFKRNLMRTGLPEAMAERDAGRLRQPHAATGALNWYRGIPFTGPIGRAKLPLTYIWGSQDAFLGRAAAELSEEFVATSHRPDYTFIELDTGHWLPETHPEDVARAVIARVRSADGAPPKSPPRSKPLRHQP
ncbi:alpha/beta fold hydrolase [Kineosporia babensis]|uniref:Alpha/beta fold hydrolase n=1 Tax=Kineosporia babensis TaxID=499548 RepID=A0A9X1NE56_9ACTN|nr:alpha/beta fold hydrolase [Kineosporia babensis]MCD5312443.1 alpha/beta fold hydrolase [Kineosporia babensis]